MRQLILLIKKYRAFLSFVLLEFFCFWLLVTNNIYQSTAFFNSSNTAVASIIKTTNDIGEFVHLKETNERLLAENAQLKYQLQQQQQRKDYNPGTRPPDIITKQYAYIPAKVESNSIRMFNNYITINKGKKNGVYPGMAVISSNGVAGIVKASSDNFSTVISLLHSEIKISSQLKGKGTFCSTTWDGESFNHGNLKYIPRDVEIKKGDSVVTSGYNALFPEGIMIGTINEFEIKDEKPFYEAKIDLSTDFSSLTYVYVITNHLKKEKEDLESDN